MSILKPRTVVLTQLPGYTVNLPSSGSDYDFLVDDGSDDGDSSDGCPRKRRRLTNLTAEEKLMRRKLKNRMAAQTARDRKKQRMNELEEELARLKAENKQLCQQNESLRQVTSVLSQENKTLKTQLETNTCPASVVTRIVSETTPESAALGTPLPQEKSRTLVQLTTQCLVESCVMMISLIYLLGLCINSTKLSSPSSSEQQEEDQMSVMMLPMVSIPSKPNKRSMLKWWGPHQKCWTPSMNS